MSKLVLFDTETGGLTLDHPTIQIGAIAVDHSLNVLEEFEVKLKFDVATADAEALKINQYNPAVWAVEAHGPVRALSNFSSFLDRHKDFEMTSKTKGTKYMVSRMAAFNADFDAPRIAHHFRQHGMFLPAHPRVLCVLERAEWWFYENPDVAKPENRKLETLAKYFSIPVDGGHDALVDCRTTLEVLKCLKGKP